MKLFKLPLFTLVTVFLIFYKGETVSAQNELKIDFEKYELANGLDIVLHEDKSDPIVAVAVEVHAGSNRETPGRTGFAHFFEHMLFKKSENVPEGYFMNKIPEWGGTRNGTTNKDRTLYYEVVPKNALEKILWMEADRLGFFINAVSKSAFETEKQVVKNEKRQRVDNVPYGHRNYVTIKALYPESHPYNWSTIGELEDLQNSTLEDVKSFYDMWYGPQNTTLVIAGDFDKAQVKQWVEKYFGEIKPHGKEAKVTPQPVALNETISLYHEDNFAKLPQLALNFPSIEQYHPDHWALDVLSDILSDGKSSPLYKKVVLEDQLAPNIYAYNSTQEIAGRFVIQANANASVDLDDLKASIFSALENFETTGVSEDALNRIKASLETDFYNSIASVQGKSFQLSHFNSFMGDPGFLMTYVKNLQKVTAEDVMRVYNKYIKGKHYIATSFVPKGQTELTLEDAKIAQVKEESIEPYVPEETVEDEENFAKTPSSFDRTIEPGFGEDPVVSAPEIWTNKLNNGLKVYGIEAKELPLVNFSIKLKGGMLLDRPDKVGVANLITDMLQEGTKTKTPEELENAIKDLGANINMYTSTQNITITANCLSKNYDDVLALVEEMLLEPRWDAKEFDRIKNETLTQISQQYASPNYITASVRNKLVYEGHIKENMTLGTEASVKKITLDDLKAYYEQYFAPNVSNFHIAGNITENQVKQSLASLESKWKEKPVTIPTELEDKTANKTGKLFFVDVPDAKQSQLNIVRLTVPANDDEMLPLTIGNFMLGSGAYGQLYKKLRVEKGYTYGAYSFPIKDSFISQLLTNTSVRTNVTKESIEVYREVVNNYRKNYSADELEKTKQSLLREEALNYETLDNLLNLLHTISTYELPLDYIDQEQDIIQNISLEEVKALINKYIDKDEMIYIVVGDKATQYERLKELGMGDPILLDKYGNEVD